MSLNLLWRGKKEEEKFNQNVHQTSAQTIRQTGGGGGEKKSQRPHRTTTRQTDEEFHSLTSQQTNNNWQMQDADLVRVFAVRLPSECHACLPLPKFAITSQFHSAFHAFNSNSKLTDKILWRRHLNWYQRTPFRRKSQGRNIFRIYRKIHDLWFLHKRRHLLAGRFNFFQVKLRGKKMSNSMKFLPYEAVTGL